MTAAVVDERESLFSAGATPPNKPVPLGITRLLAFQTVTPSV
jgi:hypothetical protein